MTQLHLMREESEAFYANCKLSRANANGTETRANQRTRRRKSSARVNADKNSLKAERAA